MKLLVVSCNTATAVYYSPCHSRFMEQVIQDEVARSRELLGEVGISDGRLCGRGGGGYAVLNNSLQLYLASVVIQI